MPFTGSEHSAAALRLVKLGLGPFRVNFGCRAAGLAGTSDRC
jgi:hypothetical protein